MRLCRSRTAPAFVCLIALATGAGGCRAVQNWLEGEPQSLREYHEAQDLFDDARYREAAVAFRAWLANYRDSDDLVRPAALYKLAECYRMTGNAPKAAETYTKLTELYGSSPDPTVRKLVELARLRLKDIRPPAKTPEADRKGDR
jgi:TolA-binding protein